jgi:hypothetical protein
MTIQDVENQTPLVSVRFKLAKRRLFPRVVDSTSRVCLNFQESMRGFRHSLSLKFQALAGAYLACSRASYLRPMRI